MCNLRTIRTVFRHIRVWLIYYPAPATRFFRDKNRKLCSLYVMFVEVTHELVVNLYALFNFAVFAFDTFRNSNSVDERIHYTRLLFLFFGS